MSEESVARRYAICSDRRSLYERMVEIRALENKVLDLFSEGLVFGTTHTSQGQEAVAVSIGASTRPSDIVTCTYRGHGVALGAGNDPRGGAG